MADSAPILPISTSDDSLKYEKESTELLDDLLKEVKSLNKKPSEKDKRDKSEDKFYKEFQDRFKQWKAKDKDEKKNNLFTMMKTGLKGLYDIGKKTWKSIKDSASFWLDLLLLLGALAIFDPGGGFLTTVINFLTDAFIWVIEAIGKYLPVVLVAIGKQIPKIIGAILTALGKIAEAFSGMFYNWAKKLPAGSFLKTLLEFFGWLFSKEGTIGKTIAALKEFFGLLFEGKIGEAFKSLFVNLITIVLELGGKLMGVLKSAFNGIFDWLIDLVGGPDSFLGVIFGGLKKIFGGIFDFFSDIFGALKDLFTGKISFWEFIKKIGTALWNLLTGIIEAIWGMIKGLGKWLWNLLKGIGKSIWEFLKKIPGMLWDGIKAAFGALADLGSWLWEKIKSGFSGIAGFFKEYLIDPIVKFFRNAAATVTNGAKNLAIDNANASVESRTEFEDISKNLGFGDDSDKRQAVEYTMKNLGKTVKEGGGDVGKTKEGLKTLADELRKKYKGKLSDEEIEKLVSLSNRASVDMMEAIAKDKIKINMASGTADFQSEDATKYLQEINRSLKEKPIQVQVNSSATNQIAEGGKGAPSR
jgi:hypothetical protein